MFIYLATFSDTALLVVRIALGALLIAHGWPKLKDLKTTAHNFNQMGFKPGALFGTAAALLEFFGGIAIVIGFMTQVVAALLVGEFVVTTLWRISKKHPFANGWELDLLILASAILLLSVGAGNHSVDSSIFLGGF
jgi:putative oxidoreductase